MDLYRDVRERQKRVTVELSSTEYSSEIFVVKEIERVQSKTFGPDVPSSGYNNISLLDREFLLIK